MRVVFLLLLAGSCYGWQPGLEYVYNYNGVVGMGIPEINGQASVSAITAEIVIQVGKNESEHGAAMVQLRNIYVGEGNTEGLTCESFPCFDDYANMNELNCSCLESPFKVYIQNNLEIVLEDKADSVLWRTNLRKGILSIFSNEVLRANSNPQLLETVSDYHVALHKGVPVPVFSIYEETILGNCRVDYRLNKLPEKMSGPKFHSLDEELEDCQKNTTKIGEITKKPTKTSKTKKHRYTKKTSRKSTKTRPKSPERLVKPECVPIAQELYRLVRTIDFDDCKERVELQQTPLGFHKPIGGNQYEWMRSRSSQSVYLLRGTPGAFRVEEALIQGAVTMTPYGIKTQLMTSSTEQMFSLKSVNVIGSGLELPASCQQVDTWLQEVHTFFPKSHHDSPNWVKYVNKKFEFPITDVFTGEDPNPTQRKKDVDEIKDEIRVLLRDVSEVLTDLDLDIQTVPGEIPTKLDTVWKHMANLDKEQIIELLKKILEQDSNMEKYVLSPVLAVDIAGALPHPFGLAAVLELSHDAKYNLERQVVALFITMTANVGGPTVIPTLIEYATGLNLGEKPFSTSIIWLNLANLIRKLCYTQDASRVKFFGPLMGDSQHCDFVLIEDVFIKRLKGIIEDGSAPSWQRTVSVLALQSIGSPLSIPILEPIILKRPDMKTEGSTKLRTAAIYGLEMFKLPYAYRKQTMTILETVFHNYGEVDEIRMSALATLISWNPDASFWHLLAKSTWSEPSKNVASFMRTTIESVANTRDRMMEPMSKIALHALQFAKPIAPSLKYSFNAMQSGEVPSMFAQKFENMAMLSEGHQIPSQIYYFVITHLGGFRMINLEFWISHQGPRFRDVFKMADDVPGSFEGIPRNVAESFLKKIEEIVLPKEVGLKTSPIPETHIWFKFLENSIILLPIAAETLQAHPFASSDVIQEIGVKLMMGHESVLAKFIKPIYLFSFLPTELGMPLITTLSLPIVASFSAFTKLDRSLLTSGISKAGMETEALLRLSTKAESRMDIHTPWLNSYVSTGVTSKREVMQSGLLFLKSDFTNEVGMKYGGTFNKVTLSFGLERKKSYVAFHASNTPFTSIDPIYDLKRHRTQERVPISRGLRETKLPSSIVTAATGIPFDVTWKSDFGWPFGLWTLNKVRTHLAGMPWFVLSLGSPTAEMFSIDLHYVPTGSSTKQVNFEFSFAHIKTKEEDPGQITQTTGDQYDQYSQEPMDYGQSQQSQGLFEGDAGFFETEVPSEDGQQDWDQMIMSTSQKYCSKYGGKSVITTGLKVTFLGDEEIFYGHTHTVTANVDQGTRRNIRRGRLTLIRGPNPLFDTDDKTQKICLDSKVETPVLRSLETFEEFWKHNLATRVKLDVTPDCEGAPVLTLSGALEMSNVNKNKVIEVFKSTLCKGKPCHDFSSKDHMALFLNQAHYDDIYFDLGWTQVCDRHTHPLLTWLTEFMDDMKVKPCDATPAELTRNFHFVGTRDLKTQNWNLELTRGVVGLLSFKDYVDEDDTLKYLSAVGLYADPLMYSEHIDDNVAESTQCMLGTDHVRTFDGFEYSYEPSQCWKVAALFSPINYVVTHHFTRLTVLVRSVDSDPHISEARIIWPFIGLVADVTVEGIKVNGRDINFITDEEIIKGDNGEVVCVVRKGSLNTYQLEIPSILVITLHDVIKIKLNDYNQITRGMCGDFDGETVGEMVGPKNCYYADSSMFVNSWTGPSARCDIYELLGIRQEVDKIENKCATHLQEVRKEGLYDEWCLTSGWQTEMLSHWTNGAHSGEDLICVTDDPVLSCDTSAGCFKLGNTVMEVTVKCWTPSTCPSIVQSSLSARTLLGSSVGVRGESYHRVKVNVPEQCLSNSTLHGSTVLY